jgi:hypothetical protein
VKDKLNSGDVKELLDTLRSENEFIHIQERYFKLAGCKHGVYNPHITNLVFFIDEAHSKTKEKYRVNVKLIKGKKERRKYLYGEQYVYAMVFVARRGEKINSLSAKLSYLKWRRPSGDFFLFSIAKTFVSGFGEASLEEKAEEGKKEKDTVDLEMTELGSSGGTHLFFGVKKIPLKVNTIDRVTIIGFDDISPQATFANYSKSRITTSIGVMWTPIKKEIEDEEKRQNLFEGFAFAHYYFKIPKLPIPQYDRKRPIFSWWKQLSISLVVGTKLETPLFDDIYVGGCIGNFFLNSMGIVFGCNFRTPINLDPQDTTKKRRKKSFSMGLTFIF